jgi:hypothetical protein
MYERDVRARVVFLIFSFCELGALLNGEETFFCTRSEMMRKFTAKVGFGRSSKPFYGRSNVRGRFVNTFFSI